MPMRIDTFISKTRIIDVKSRDLRGALKELLKVCPFHKKDKINRETLLDALIDREKNMTTCLGHGLAMPHLRVPMGTRKYMIAVGRVPEGLDYEGMPEYKDVRLVLLLLASEKDQNYLNVLASLAKLFEDGEMVDRIAGADDLVSLRSQVMKAFGGATIRRKPPRNRFNGLILREAVKVAKGAKCSSMVVFSDTFGDGVEIDHQFTGFKTVLVAKSGTVTEDMENTKGVDAVISVRAYANTRLSQLRSAILVGLTRGVFKFNDRLCCVGGLPQSNLLDTLVVVDVEREFQSVLMHQANLLPAGVRPEVVERVIAIATELGVEGREGRPVGCLFVLGDAAEIKPHTKPLVLNPFFGYRDEDRNILNPFMDETVKELSSIDGAFIIRGDGVLESAGSLIHAPEFHYQLPSGLGTRHSAAAAISMAADCIAIVVSASAGQVTLFRRGEMIPLIEKAIGRHF